MLRRSGSLSNVAGIGAFLVVVLIVVVVGSVGAQTLSSTCLWRGEEVITENDGGTIVESRTEDCRTVRTCTTSPCPQSCSNVTCVCLEDYEGDRCQSVRPYSCSWVLEDPVEDCEFPNIPYPTELDGKFSCLRFRTTDRVPFTFRLRCRFANPTRTVPGLTNTTLVADIAADFVAASLYYIYTSDKFIISNNRFPQLAPTRLRFHPINFLRLGATAHDASAGPLALQQWDESATISVPSVDLSRFSADYFSGNRLFIEAGFSDRDYYGTYVTSQIYLDLVDRVPPPPTTTKSSPVGIAVGIIVPIACITIAIVYFVRRRYVKKVVLKSVENVRELSMSFVPLHERNVNAKAD